MAKKIFFVAYGGGHINLIDLVAKEILLDKEYEVVILALTTGYQKVIDTYPYGIVKRLLDYEFLFQDKIDTIKKIGNDFLKENYNPSSGISKDETILYLGLSMYELIQKYGSKKAHKLYNERKRQAFLPIETIKRFCYMRSLH